MKHYYVLGNGTEWCYYSWKGVLNKDHSIFFINDKLPFSGPRLLALLCKAHYALRLNAKRRLPFKCIWYNRILKKLNIDERDKNYLIVYDRNRLLLDLDFFKYVRRKKPDIKIIYLFSNIVKFTGAKEWNILNDLNSYFDKIFAFDKTDAEKYGFSYFPLIYTKCVPMDNKNPYFDLFYIGKAKDRYKQLIDVFEKAQKEGLRCDFNIVGVPKEEQLYGDVIHYDQPLSYREVLDRMNNARCIVDMIQGQSTAFTIKTCEAVLYDKKLITSNVYVKKESFYNKNMMLIYPEEQSLSQFLSLDIIPFDQNSKNSFSPYTLFSII